MSTTKMAPKAPKKKATHAPPVKKRAHVASYKAPEYPPETPASELPRLMTVGQVCSWLGISRPKIQRMARAGELHHSAAGLDRRYHLFDRDEVVSYRDTDVRYITTQAYVARAKKAPASPTTTEES